MILEEYLILNRHKFTKKDFAKMLGITESHCLRITKGTSKPSLKLAQKIEETTEGNVSKMEALFPEDFKNSIFKEEVLKLARKET